MRLARILVAVVVGLALVAAAPSAQAAKVKKAKEHHMHGVVTAIDKNTITLTVKHKDKTTKQVTEETKTITVSDATQYFKAVHHKKGQPKTEIKPDAAAFGDVAVGEKLNVDLMGADVLKVTIHGKKKA